MQIIAIQLFTTAILLFISSTALIILEIRSEKMEEEWTLEMKDEEAEDYEIYAEIFDDMIWNDF